MSRGSLLRKNFRNEVVQGPEIVPEITERGLRSKDEPDVPRDVTPEWDGRPNFKMMNGR